MHHKTWTPQTVFASYNYNQFISSKAKSQIPLNRKVRRRRTERMENKQSTDKQKDAKCK